MNQEIRIAVCDDLAEDEGEYHPAAFGIHRQNNLYVENRSNFRSGEAIFILRYIRLFTGFYGYFYEWDERYGDGEEADFKKQPGADRVREHQYGVCSRGL